MDIKAWLLALPHFLILLPSAASCYLPTKKQLRYPPAKTALLCMAVLVPYSLAGAWIRVILNCNTYAILLPSLVPFFFLYRHTVKMDLSRALAVYVGVCAAQTFPAQFAFAFDARLHPGSGAAFLSPEATLLQLCLACLLPLLSAYPAMRYFSWVLDYLNYSKIWYCTVAVSVVFLFLNILSAPISYSTLLAGRLSFLYPVLEGGALIVLAAVYVLFYQVARLLLEQMLLEKQAQLLEMQSHQYRTLQSYLEQTRKLRHDFRHSVRLLSSLAEQGDLASIRSHLAAYETSLTEVPPPHYCANAALNALFGYYQQMGADAGVDMEWKISLPAPLPISELDMAALFGNLLENAIAGCLTLPEGKRYFSLTTESVHGNCLYIVSTNSFDGQVRKGKDGYRSTKHRGRGTGLASIAAVAEKYNGSVQASNSDKEFFLDVMLKING